MKNPALKRKRCGFTLIELLLAVIIIGILVMAGISGFGTASTDTARAGNLVATATKLSTNWIYTAAGMGISTSIDSAEAEGSGIFDDSDTTDGANEHTVLELMVDHDNTILTTEYETEFQALGIRSMLDLGEWRDSTDDTGLASSHGSKTYDGTTAMGFTDSYYVDDYAVTMASNGTDPQDIDIAFEGVPKGVGVAAEGVVIGGVASYDNSNSTLTFTYSPY